MRCALLCLTITAGAARADTGVIAIGPQRAPISAALVDAIGPGALDDAIGRARAQLAAGAVPIETLARFRHVRALTDEGWSAFQHVSFDVAASRLAAARGEAELLVALPGGAELYADASLRLGVVMARQGRAQDAHDVVALALARDPDRPITTAEFSPDVLELADAVRASPAPAQHVRIAAEPASAILSVDGVELGASPVETDLPRGQHVVVARAPLHEPRAQSVAVDASTTSIHLALERDREAEELVGGADAATDDALRALVDVTERYAGVDEIVLATVVDRRGGPSLLVERCAGARCTPVVEVGFADAAGLPAAVKSAWASVRAGEPRGPAVVLRAGGDDVVEHRCKLCRNPYVIGGTAAAVVLGAIAIFAATSGGKPSPDLHVPNHF